jgi:hypothetical protein
VIRYVISFPVEAHITEPFFREFVERLKEASEAHEWRDIVLTQGGTITDMRRSRRVSSLVRRARASVR